MGDLLDALKPIIPRFPHESDLNEGSHSVDPQRMSIDGMAFVELSQGRRNYRLCQDLNDERRLLVETEALDVVVDAVAAYLARRVVEREKRLPAGAIAFNPIHTGISLPLRSRQRWFIGALHWFAQAFWFVVEVLGLLLVFALLWMVADRIWGSG